MPTHTLNGVNYTYTVGQSAASVAVTASATGAVTIVPSFVVGGSTYNVTSIGEEAFRLCSGLTSITIPNTVTIIGIGAFSFCSGLTSITIPNSVTIIKRSAFFACTGLTSITIPSSVTTIEQTAFQGLGLTSVTIPNTVTTIGEYVLAACQNLTTCNWLSASTSIPNFTFHSCSSLTSITISNSVTSIGANAFMYCTGLQSLTIPNSVTSIGANAFKYCRELTTLTIPNLVTTINDETFWDCPKLTSITLSTSLTSIGNAAFSYCSGLTSITIPNSVTLIKESAFWHCSGLLSVTLSTSLIIIEKNAFYSCIGLTSITIPSSVTTIGQAAFQSCSSLTSITIPASVTTIGQTAFSNCNNITSFSVNTNNPNFLSENGALFNKNKTELFYYPSASTNTSFIIPDSVILINIGTFNTCVNLTSVTIPSSIFSINSYVFFNCNNLLSVTFLGVIPSIDYGNFAATGDTAIYKSNLNTDTTLALNKLSMFTNKNTSTTQELVPTITNFSIPAKAFGDAPFTIIDPSSNSTGAFNYMSSNTGVATINGKVVTIVGVGSSTISAIQLNATNYISGIISATLTTIKGTPTITNFSFTPKQIGNTAFTITDPSSNSTGDFTYTSSNTAVATISGKTVTIIGRGTSTITATQAATTNFNSGTTTATLTVTNPLPTITALSISAKTIIDAPFTITDPSSNSAGLFTYTSSNLAVATIVEKTITIVGAGTSIITATQTATASYISGTITATLTVTKLVPTISVLSISAKTFGDAPFIISDPSSNSPGLFTYTSSNLGLATINGKTITIVEAGTSIITAIQASTAIYTSRTITATLTINKATPVLTILNYGIKTIGDASFNIIPPTTNSDGLITYTSSNAEVATATNGNSKLYVAGGQGVTPLASSTDGVNWTGRGSGVFTSRVLTIAYGNNLYVAGGSGGNTIATSTDGIVWTGRGTASLSSGVSTVAYGNNIWVAIGQNANLSTISTSTDGITWTSRTGSTIFTNGYGVVYGNNLFVAVGAGPNEFATSTDGINWIGRGVKSIFSNHPTKISYGNGLYVATGNGTNTIATSTDGINWTGRVVFTNVAYDVAYGNGLWVAVGGNSGNTIATSTDGVVWTGRGTTVYSTVAFGVGYAYGLWIATGRAGTNSIATSYNGISWTGRGKTIFTNGWCIATSGIPITPGIISIIGTGTSTITATQESTNNYFAATICVPFSVETTTATITPTLSNFDAITKIVGDASFSLTQPTSTNTTINTFTYTSSDPYIATVSGNVVTIIGGGSCIIYATQSGDATYKSATITTTLTVGQQTPVLSNFSLPTKTFGDATFAISTPPTTNSTGAFSYTSSNTAVATIVGTTVTIVGAGTSTITATQAATLNSTSGTITTTLTVGQITPTIGAFSISAKTFEEAPFTITNPSSNSAGAFTYTSSDLAVATIVGNTVTIVGAGTSTITLTQASAGNYASRTTTATLTVSQGTPTISALSISAKAFGDAPFTITDPSSNSTGLITYTSSNLAVATIAGKIMTIVGLGTSTITATQAATTNFVSGTITTSLTVSKGTPTIPNFSFANRIIGDAAFTITDPSSNSTGTFTYASSNLAVATISGKTVTIIGRGTSTITATQAATTNFNSGTKTATLTVTNPVPTITALSISAKTFGDAPFTITDPSSNSAGLFTYTSSNLAVATIAGKTITIVGAGTSTITATQASTTSYASGTTTATLTVNQITTVLQNFSVSTKKIGDADFQITDPSSNNAGLFTYTSSNTAVATIVGKTVSMVGAGTTTITATQAATTNYTSATITATFQVNPAQDTAVLTGFSVPTKRVGNAPFLITDPSSNSNGLFTYTSSNAAVATIVGKTITIVGAGTSTITANQESTLNYTSGTITATLTVTQGTLTLSNFSVPTKAIGDASFTITNPTSNSTGAFTYTSLNTSVATIVGNVVTIVGMGSSTITAVQASTPNYTSATITATFQVTNVLSTLSNFSIPAKTAGEAAFTIEPPSSNSTGAFTYTSSNLAVARITGSTITIFGAGTATITAVQANTAEFGPGSITASFTVNPITTVISSFDVSPRTFGAVPFKLRPVSNSNGAITYTSSDISLATIAGDMVTIVGVGSLTITASQASTNIYTSATSTATLTIGPFTTVLSNFSVSAKTFGDASFSLPVPRTTGIGLITYASSNLSVATIAGNVVTIVGAGASTITATQASTPNYTSDSISATLQVSKVTTVLADFSIEPKAIGDEAFQITEPSTESDGLFTYTSSNATVATIVGDTITIVGTGTATITAVQSGTQNYTSATITAPLTVGKLSSILSNFSIEEKTFGNPSFKINPPSSTSNGIFTYTSSNTDVATIFIDSITIVGVGTSIITANQASNRNYLAGTTTATLTVNESTSSLSNFSITAKTVGDAAFQLTAPRSTNLTGAFTYASSNTAVATIVGNTVTIVGAGTATITATQESTAEYASASITAPFTVNLLATTLSGFSVPPKTFGNAAFSLEPPTSNREGAFTYTSSNTDVATIAGSTVTIVGGGTATITASQASTSNYGAGTITDTLTVSRQTTVVSGFNVLPKAIGDAPFQLTPPTTNRLGDFTYSSSNTAVATIVGNTVTIVGVGTSIITAVQTITANFTTASITDFLNVGVRTTVLSNFSVSEKTIGDAPFQLTDPSSNSNGLITYRSSNAAVATIDGNMVTVVGTGTATITATQASTSTSTSGTITAPLIVNKLSPTISLSLEEKTFGNPSFLINPSSNSSGIFTYSSSNTDVATIFRSSITIVGVGTSIITANQASTTNYLAGTTTATLIVNESTSSLSNFSITAKTVGDAAFQLTAPRSNNLTGAFTYTSSNTAVATIVGNTVTIVGAGTATITATQESTDEYASASITAPLTVNLLATTLSGFSVPPKQFGNAAFSLEPPTSNREGAFTYTSSNTQVATIDGSTVTIVGGGTATITATQASTSNYGAGTITDTLTVSRQTTVVSTFSVEPKSFGDAPFQLTDPLTNRIGTFTYSSSNDEVATIVGNTVTIVGFGSSTITAVQASTANFTTASITGVLNVGVRTTVLSNFSVSEKTIGDAPFQLTDPSSNSNGLFTYRSSNATVATIDGNMVTVVGTGTATITATQASTTTNTSATITAPLIVNKLSPILSNFSIEEKTFGNPSFKINPPSSTSNGIFTYISSNTDVATIFIDSITIVGVGTATITANQASNRNYLAGTTTATLTVNQATAVLSNFSIAARTLGDAAFQLAAPRRTGNGLITYASSNTAVATIVGNNVTIVGAGTATITATQESTAEYASASIDAPLTVNLLATTLSGFNVPPKTFGNAAFSLEPPTSTREGAFTYTSSNTDVATIDGSTVTIVGGGSSIITATQTSTTNYLAGTITSTLRVGSAATVLTNFSIPTKDTGNANFTITAPTTNSDCSFTYFSSNTSVATIDENTITIVGAGTTTIRAIQSSSEKYLSASITAPFVVNKGAPTITNFSIETKEIGSLDFKITDPTSNSPGAFTYATSNKAVAIVSGNTISVKAIGETIITATQTMTQNFIAGTITTKFIVNKRSPVITNFTLPEKTFGDIPFIITPGATTNSNGVITYTSSNLNVATISKNLITIIGGGTSIISFNQAATPVFASGIITTTLQVNKAIPFLYNFSIFQQLLGSPPFQIEPPMSDSDGAFTYESSNTSVATIAGNTITIVGAGTSTITAIQETTSKYASIPISTVFKVIRPNPQIGDLEITNKSLDTSSFTIVNPTKPPDSTGTWSYISSDTTKATITGNLVTLLGAGIIIITGILTEDSLYNSATVFTQFAIAPRFVAPSIFPFTKSSALTNVIPRTYTPVSNTLTIPFNLFTTDLVSKLHPTTLVRKKFVEIGTVIEKLANRNLIVNTLFDMYPIYTINVPSTSIYTISSINKKKISTLRLVKPTGTTLNNPLILNTVPSDITVAFVCLFTDYANGVRINGNGKNAPLYVEVTKANDNRYRVIRGNRLKKLMVSSIVMDGSIVVFAGITLLISSNVEN